MFLLLVILNFALFVRCSKDVTLVRGVPNDHEINMRAFRTVEELQDACILDNTQQTVEKRTKNTKTILNNVEEYKESLKLDTKLRKEIKWIIKHVQESQGRRQAMRILGVLKQDTTGICLRPKDCTDLKRYTKEKLKDGVYRIYPDGIHSVHAYCDMTTDGGGWTVMLKRYGGSVSFYRRWVECEDGFGDIHGDFWFGNKYIHMLTSSGKYELRVDMVDTSNNKLYAVYKTFVVGDAASKYKLTVGGYSGNAGDRLRFHNGVKFTTNDQDNDMFKANCAVEQKGSWWYYRCSTCDFSRSIDKPYWGNPISKPVMMIRKV